MDWVEALLRKSCDRTLTKEEVLHSLFHMIEINENTLHQIQSDKRDLDRKSTRLNSSHSQQSRMPSSA